MVQLLFESKSLLPTKEELAGILWSIWNARNAYIFRSRQPQATMVVWSVEIDLGWLVGGRDDGWSCCWSVSVFEWCCSGLFRQIGLSFIGN